MTYIRRIPVFVMIFLLISVGMVYAQTIGKETLRGLKGVYVLVAQLTPDIEKDGLNSYTIKNDVELKLRMTGIKVLIKDEMMKEPGFPNLYISIDSYKNDELGLYAFKVNVQLKQNVYLERNPEILCFLVTTWESIGLTGMAGSKNLNFIRDSIKDQVDLFINDYLEMNPKE